MRILYAIQGTGNGHLARAREIVPLLSRLGQVDTLVSGQHGEVALPFEVTYKLKGLGFIFGKKGGVDMLATFARNNTRRLYKEIKALPVQAYDLIISDFEPVSCWAARMGGVPVVGLSHQGAVLAPNAPRPEETDIMGRAILSYYAPATVNYGFHFQPYDERIFTPVIRAEVRRLEPTDKGYYTVYLPAYDDERLLKVLRKLPEAKFQVFSKHSKAAYREDNCRMQPIDNEAFLQSMAGSTGVLCGAGFETPAEALFLSKKLMVVPMKRQYEQQCNAAALADMGVPVLKNFKKRRLPQILEWLAEPTPSQPMLYPDETFRILEMIVARHAGKPNQLADPMVLPSTSLQLPIAH